MTKLKLLLVTVIVLACAERKIELVKNEEHRYSMTRYRLDNTVRLKAPGTLHIKDSAQAVSYSYILESDKHEFEFVKLTEFKLNDSSVVVNEDTCRRTGRFEFQVDGREIMMKRYLLDDPQAFDDESNVFVVSGYGVFMMKSKAWGDLMVFDRALGFEQALLSKVLTDYELLLGTKPY